MKVKILGSGSAFGAPMIFNSWGRLNPNNPKNNRTRASLFLDIDGYNILVDASPELRTQINKNNITNIDAVIITHGHYDHTGGIPELPRAAKILDHGINIYATQETLSGIKSNFSYLFNAKADAEPNSISLHWKEIPEWFSRKRTYCSRIQIQRRLFYELPCQQIHRMHRALLRPPLRPRELLLPG